MKKKYKMLINEGNLLERTLFKLNDFIEKIFYETNSKIKINLETKRTLKGYKHNIKVDKNIGIPFEQYFEIIKNIEEGSERILDENKNSGSVEISTETYIIKFDPLGIRRLIKKYQ